jgi:nitrogen fixation NifU-like protein
MDLKDLYRDVILDHNRSPRQFGRLDPADSSADGHNPLCGDRLHLTLKLDGDRVADLRFEGKGCAISVASASLMCEAVKGRARAEIAHLFNEVHQVLTRRCPKTWASSRHCRGSGSSRFASSARASRGTR